ncbi:MAG: glycoside hydrolase family 57 protein [Desulfurococcaceae archaeon]
MRCRELYILLNSPIQQTGELAELLILSDCIETSEIDIELRDHRGVLKKTTLSIQPSRPVTYIYEFQAPRIPGRYELTLRMNNEVVDKAQYIVDNGDLIGDRLLAFVWHNHQAPNYLPDGKYYFPWAFIHTYGDELSPYGRGPYQYHTKLLEKYRDYKATFNISPSLLYQWSQLINKGIEFHDGTRIDSTSLEAEIVRETLQSYRMSTVNGQIDVLTSIYAHTISGYIIDYLGAEDIIREEIEYGISITKEFIGINPRGAWTPEMAFSMKLVDIYHDLGLEYTVLDAKCHLEKSEGDIGSFLEPYTVRGSTGEIIVFVRDTELSNILGFRNNFNSIAHAWKSAYDLAYKIASRVYKGGLLTLALDGENWMIFSRNPPLTAIFYDKLIDLLVRMQKSSFLRMIKLREAVEKIAPRKVLTKVPTTSWLCGSSKWNGEIRQHSIYWEKVKNTYKMIKEFESLHGISEKTRRARWALWHALDSDYWWADFWEPILIDVWLCEAEKALGYSYMECPHKIQSTHI